MGRLAWSYAEALVRATARVERRRAGRWEYHGTAFFITGTSLLTCAHVVAGHGATRVVWTGGEGPETDSVRIELRVPDAGSPDDYPLPDVALLSLTAARYDGPLPTLRAANPSDNLLAYGYTDEYRRGEALGHTSRFRFAGPEEAGPAAAGTGTLFRIIGDRVRGGMSGSPVLDLETGHVVGMVKRTQDREKALGAFCVPAATALKHVPEAASAAVPDLVDLAPQLWRDLYWGAVALLVDSDGTRQALAQRLKLDDRLAGDAERQARQIAAELFRLDLEGLAETAQGLFDVFRDMRARRLFDLVATCTDFQDDAWIAADVAAEISAQVAMAADRADGPGRVLDIRSGTDLLNAYLRRASSDRPWDEPVDCGPYSHEIDPDTGIPVDTKRDLRMGIAAKFPDLSSQGFGDPDPAPDILRRWQEEWHPILMTVLRKKRTVALLPRQMPLDPRLVEALAQEYPFVLLNTSSAAAGDDVKAMPAYQALEPDVKASVAMYAWLVYHQTQHALS
ncbi:S1 family peptidase [Actinoplanes sp. CA-030573]|uniref:S1 family peptidase n=1 Tax=Actinoplanes sp. CA-030573 TaxID=3239898 RepID=UPI003D915E81